MHQDQECTFEQKMKQDAPAKTLEQRKQNSGCCTHLKNQATQHMNHANVEHHTTPKTLRLRVMKI
jgi:hypothetical protein